MQSTAVKKKKKERKTDRKRKEKMNCDNLQTTYLQLLYGLGNVCNAVLCLAFNFNCHSLRSGFVFSEIRCQLAVLCKLHVISVVGISMEAA